jgi:hypothetical protein
MLGRRAIGIEMMRERRQAAKTRVEEGESRNKRYAFFRKRRSLTSPCIGENRSPRNAAFLLYPHLKMDLTCILMMPIWLGIMEHKITRFIPSNNSYNLHSARYKPSGTDVEWLT